MNRTALVTGADGFIGSHLVEMLVHKGYKVRALCQYNSLGTWGWLENSPFASDVEIVLGDVRDSFQCLEITKNIDYIFNLAALIAIPYSYKAPQSYVDTNVQGALNLCQGALQGKVQRFIQMSTSEVYGTAVSTPISETHPLQPQSPYSASKIASDAIAMSHFYTFGLNVSVARPFNTYGPRQSARAIIPSIVSQITSGNSEIYIGDLNPTRDFSYVEDIVVGLIQLAESSKTIGDVFNIGYGKEISIRDLVNLIASLMGKEVNLLQEDDRLRPTKSEVMRLLCDNQKAKMTFDYCPKVTLEKGLLKTIDWFSNNKNLKFYKTDIVNV